MHCNGKKGSLWWRDVSSGRNWEEESAWSLEKLRQMSYQHPATVCGSLRREHGGGNGNIHVIHPLSCSWFV